MKILKEAKDNLPISFLTNLISKGWEEVGYLQEQQKAIKDTFKGTKKVEDLLQGLIDAYLICIGQTETLMKDKSYIEMPEEAEEDKKELSEDLLIKVTPLTDLEPIVDTNNTEDITVCSTCATEPVCTDENCVECNSNQDSNNDIADSSTDPFEYLCDFDEPDLSKPAVTDADLYLEDTRKELF